MGGVGSTRWAGHDAKPLVEKAICLDLLAPELKETLAEPRASGEITWSGATGEPKAWARFWLAPVESDGSKKRLVLDFSGDDYSPREVVFLEHVKVGFALRWHAKCPDCAARARKIYLDPKRLRFLCWRCAGLQYSAAQKHDGRIDACRRDPDAWLQGRSHLEGSGSAFVTLRVLEEAERRGCLWAASPRFRKMLLEDASPEWRAWMERIAASAPPKRLPKRRDRLSGFRRGSAGRR
jgi:hypothetical protein